MRKIRNLLSMPLVLAISMAGYGEVKAAPVGTPKETNIAIGTHSVGGAYYASGSGLAKVISEHSTMKAVVKPHAGPNAWMPQLDNERDQRLSDPCQEPSLHDDGQYQSDPGHHRPQGFRHQQRQGPEGQARGSALRRQHHHRQADGGADG